MDFEMFSLVDSCKLLGVTEATFLNALMADKIRPVVYSPDRKAYLYVSAEVVKFFYFSGDVGDEATSPLYEKIGDSYSEVVATIENSSDTLDNPKYKLSLVKKQFMYFLVKDLLSSSQDKNVKTPSIELDTICFQNITIDGNTFKLNTRESDVVRYLYEQKKLGRNIVSDEEYFSAKQIKGENRIDKIFQSKKALFEKIITRPAAESVHII